MPVHYSTARFAYSYRVWITLIKLPYAPLRYLEIKPDIHEGESLCGRLIRPLLRVSEKNPSETVRKGAGVALGPRFWPLREGEIGPLCSFGPLAEPRFGLCRDFSDSFSRQ